MKRTNRMFAVPITALILILAFAATPASANTNLPTRFYDTNSLSSGVVTAGVGSDQCSKPLSERKGPSFCPFAQDSAEWSKATRRSVSPSTLAAPATGGCSALGCWYYNANYWTEFDGGGYYNWNTTQLGQVFINSN